MATARQKSAARKNIRKAQQARRAKSARGRGAAATKAGSRSAAARKSVRPKSKTRSKTKTRSRAKTRSKATARSKTARAKSSARTRPTARSKKPARSKTAARPQTSRRAQPKARRRAKPGSTGTRFFHIEVQPKADFVAFRTQDVGSEGGIERVAGKRAGGAWSTQKWLIARDQAHIEGDALVGDSADARKVLTLFGTPPRRIRANRFSADDGAHGRASAKPTKAPREIGPDDFRKPQRGRKWA